MREQGKNRPGVENISVCENLLLKYGGAVGRGEEREGREINKIASFI